MVEGIAIKVGGPDADIIGQDNCALQAAVDYVANLGGGTVLVGAGTYLMRDSLRLRSRVTIQGEGRQTILRKADAVESPLVLDGDYGEEQITVANRTGFAPGVGVAVKDDRAEDWGVTVATIIGADGDAFHLSAPLEFDYLIARGAMAQSVYPVITGHRILDARVEGLTIDGNRTHNPFLNGCRGAGIYLHRGHRCSVVDCLVHDFNGDGISLQHCDDAHVERCECTGNAWLGLHPGSGSQRPIVADCYSHHNGAIGLFLCWRVRHGRFERNILAHNGESGMSIGHKDTDNVFLANESRCNGHHGIYFRDESEPMSGHRNRFVGCRILDNGSPEREGMGVRVEGYTRDLAFEDCTIGDTRPPGQKTQAVGVSVGPKAGPVRLARVDMSGNGRAEVESEAGDQAIRRL